MVPASRCTRRPQEIWTVTTEQEMASLLHIRDSFPKYLLIDQDIPAHYSEQGIRIMSVEDFLLGKR